MPDMKVKFGTVEFLNPLVAASGTPTKDYEHAKRAVEAGIGGIVVKNIVSDKLSYMRQWPRPRFRLLDTNINKGKLDQFNLYSIEQGYPGTVASYAKEIEKMKKSFEVPVFGSLIATDLSEWVKICRILEAAGADGIEINVSCPHGAGGLPSLTDILNAVSQEVKIPLVPKLRPTDDLVGVVRKIENKASGVTICNRLTGLDIDIDREKPIMHGSYAGFGGPWTKYYVYKFVFDVALNSSLPISASGGVMSWRDVVKYILLGATTVQVCSTVILNGYQEITKIVQGLRKYLEDKRYENFCQVRGKALKNIIPLSEIERNPPVYAFVDEDKCNACRRCLEVCFFDALEMRSKAFSDPNKCDGCGLCIEICPSDAIRMKRKG